MRGQALCVKSWTALRKGTDDFLFFRAARIERVEMASNLCAKKMSVKMKRVCQPHGCCSSANEEDSRGWQEQLQIFFPLFFLQSVGFQVSNKELGSYRAACLGLSFHLFFLVALPARQNIMNKSCRRQLKRDALRETHGFIYLFIFFLKRISFSLPFLEEYSRFIRP